MLVMVLLYLTKLKFFCICTSVASIHCKIKLCITVPIYTCNNQLLSASFTTEKLKSLKTNIVINVKNVKLLWYVIRFEWTGNVIGIPKEKKGRRAKYID